MLDNNQIKKIVIIRTDRIGEVLLSSSIVDVLDRHVPHAQITFVTSGIAKEVMEYKSHIDDLIVFDTMDRKVGYSDAFRFSRLLKKKKFDLAIIVNPHKMLHLSTFLAGIKYRIGFNRKWAPLLTHAFVDKRNEGARHEIEYSLELLEAIDIRQSFIKPQLSINQEDIINVRDKLQSLGVNIFKKNMLVQPGSNFVEKRWPKEYYIDLISNILKEADVNILLSGALNEKDLCDEIAGNFSGEVSNLCGRITLKELVPLIKMVDLFIGNDSGPMHIAYCCETPLIAIFGRGTKGAGPNRWAPKGEKCLIFYENAGCDDCLNENCPHDFKCLKMIKPRDVFEGVKSYL